MRVIFVSHLFPNTEDPINGSFNLSRVRALQKAGCTVKVISPIGLTPPERMFFPRPQAKKILQHIRGKLELTLPNKYADYDVEYLHWFWLPKRWFWPSEDFLLHLCVGKRIKAIIRQFRPDAVISSWLHPEGTYLKRIECNGIQSLLSIAEGSDFLVKRNHHPGWEAIKHKLNSTRSVMVCVSRRMYEVAKREMVTKEIRFIPNGFDTDVFDFSSPSVSAQSDVVRLLAVGNLNYTKGHDVLLDALVRLGPQYHLSVIGDGEKRGEYEEFIRKHELAARVQFLGFVGRAEVREHLDTSDIFCMPSRSEGMPISALEALGCGVPVVASDVGGLADIIVHGFNGYLTRPADVDDLVQKIGLAAQTKWDHQEIAARAHLMFGWDKWASSIIGLIEGRVGK